MHYIYKNNVSYLGTEDNDPPLSFPATVANLAMFLGLIVVLGLYALMLQ